MKARHAAQWHTWRYGVVRETEETMRVICRCPTSGQGILTLRHRLDFAKRNRYVRQAPARQAALGVHVAPIPSVVLYNFGKGSQALYPGCPSPSNATGLGSHMAHLITFTTARFDISKEPPNPINPIAGHVVLTWLREELLRAHYRVSEPDTEDWDGTFTSTVRARRIWWARVGRRTMPVRQSSGRSKCIGIDR